MSYKKITFNYTTYQVRHNPTERSKLLTDLYQNLIKLNTIQPNQAKLMADWMSGFWSLLPNNNTDWYRLYKSEPFQ